MRFRIRLRLISTHHRYWTASEREQCARPGFSKGPRDRNINVPCTLRCCTNCGNYRKTEYLGHNSHRLDRTRRGRFSRIVSWRKLMKFEEEWGHKENWLSPIMLFGSWYAKSAGKFLIFQPFHESYFWYRFSRRTSRGTNQYFAHSKVILLPS